MVQLIIEPAGRDELSALLSLYSHLHPDDPEVEESRAHAIWERLIESRETTVFVARAGDTLVGSCTISIIPNLTRGGRSHAIIENVVTQTDHRRQGIGRTLLAAAVGHASSADCYKVVLATGSQREETLRFYERAGFAKGTKTYFEMRQ
jgi:ribosomal protein S18 acetylase RimI-like enzyme